jgi:uncharacterized protein (DUF305 family)
MTLLRVRHYVVLLATAAFVTQVPSQAHSDDAEFMERMNASMTAMNGSMKAAAMNGNVDHDFAAMMIPHHEGAIEMAKAELSFGRDKTMRRLAQEILVDQKSEIDAMNLWLAKQSSTPPREITK